MKKRIQICDGCNTQLHPNQRLDMGIGDPPIWYHICYGCALKLNEGDEALDAIIMAKGRKRGFAAGSIVGVLAA